MANHRPVADRRGTDRSPSDAVRSLEWTAAIERASSKIPRRRGLVRHRTREYVHDNRVAAAVDLRRSGLPVDLGGASVLTKTASAPRARSAATADLVVAGAMRTARLLRFRSFYLSAGRSLVVHQRYKGAPTPLVSGSTLQMTVTGRTPFIVPRVLDTGCYLPPNADWVVEEAIDAAPVAREDAATTAREVLELLPEMWRRLGTQSLPLEGDQRAPALTALVDLAQNPPDGIWPADVGRDTATRSLQDLLTDERSLTVGLSHGDPGLGNILRHADGRLALVDWEDAGHRPVAHDVVKVVMSSPDPVRLAADLPVPVSLQPVLASPAVMPWRLQAATALALFLRGWRYRHRRAVKRGSTASSRRRMHAMIRVLDVLLDD